jgi:hypothetical protein
MDAARKASGSDLRARTQGIKAIFFIGMTRCPLDVVAMQQSDGPGLPLKGCGFG